MPFDTDTLNPEELKQKKAELNDLCQKIRDDVFEFETEHPALTRAVNEMIEAVRNLGI